MNPMLLCPMVAAAISGEVPMTKIPDGYVSGICHYTSGSPKGYTIVTDGDARTGIVAKYGEAIDITLGDETVITWSDLDRPRNLAKDKILMIVLVKQGGTSRVHVSTLVTPPAEGPRP